MIPRSICTGGQRTDVIFVFDDCIGDRFQLTFNVLWYCRMRMTTCEFKNDEKCKEVNLFHFIRAFKPGNVQDNWAGNRPD
ncbi:MAG: hypothetical protein GY880_08665 [Planctomycetaceae bacterium]|nr:hypothetical protein [Planctomycetaceae bacterium]